MLDSWNLVPKNSFCFQKLFYQNNVLEKYLSADQLENLCRKEFNSIAAQNNKGALIFKFLQSKDQIN